MEKRHQATLEQLSWAQAKSIAEQVNAIGTSTIDNLSPGTEHRVYRARYPFGSKIVYDGKFHIPNPEGRVVPLDHPSISDQIQEDLNYRSVPMMLVIRNKSEVHFEMNQRVISLNLFAPGSIVGLWETLDSQTSYLAKRIWTVFSGVRSIFLVPRFADAGQHKILQRQYGTPSAIPKDLGDHWKTLTAIANHQNFEQEWHFEVLLFSRPFVESTRKDKAWKDYQLFLYQTGWEQTYYWRNKVTYDLIWQILISHLEDENIRVDQYDLYLLKHLGLIGMRILPGFTAATTDDCAPISGLQNVIVNDYRETRYFPTIMVPHVLAPEENTKLYYVLQHPTMLDCPFKNYSHPTLITTLRAVKQLEQKFRQAALAGKLMIEGTPIEDFIRNINIECFHSEKDTYGGVQLSQNLHLDDPALVSYPDKSGKMRFADNSQFARGCIRISNK